MNDHATLMLVWSADGQTRVIDMVDDGGDLTYLVRLFVDALPDDVKAGAEAAVLRGVVADQQEVIRKLRGRVRAGKRVAREAAELAEKYRELEREREYLNTLTHIVPVEAS